MLKISIRMTEEQKNQIESLSEAEGISVSEWIRKVIEHHLEHHTEVQLSELAIAESKALFEMRFLTRYILRKLSNDQTETAQIIHQAKMAAMELLQEKLKTDSIE